MTPDTTRTEHPLPDAVASVERFLRGEASDLHVNEDALHVVLAGLREAEAQTAAAVEALRRIVDKRTAQDDGYWISAREMRYAEEALNDSTASARFIADVEKPWRDVTRRLRGRLRGSARHEPHCRETNLDETQGIGVCTCGLLSLMAEARALLATTPSAEAGDG